MPQLILLSQNFIEFNMFIITAFTHGRKGYYFHFPKEEQRHGGCAWSVPEWEQGTAPQLPTLSGLLARSPRLVHPEPAILLASAGTQFQWIALIQTFLFRNIDVVKKVIHIHPPEWE